MSIQLRSDPVEIAAGHLAAGRVAEAKAIYDDLLRDQPANARALCGLGSIALQHGDVARGFELIARASAIAPADGHAVGNLAVAYLARGELAQAEDCSRRALDLEPGSAELHANFASVLMERGNIAEALVAQRHAIDLAPESAVQRFNLANLLLAHGQPVAAAAELQAALELDPDHTGSLNNLAVLHKQAGRLDAARALLQEARLRDPLNPQLMANHADLILQSGQSAEALEMMKRATSLSPRNPVLQSALGAMLIEVGQLADAGQVLADAMRSAPGDAGVAIMLARMLRRQSRLDAAQAAVERAASLRGAPGVVNPLAVEILLMRGQYADAWSRLDLAINNAPAPFAEPRLGADTDLAGASIRLVAMDGSASLFAARFLPALAKRGAILTVLCPPVLAPLFETVAGVTSVVPMAAINLASLAQDGQPTLLLDSLPHRLRATPEAPSPDWPIFNVAAAVAVEPAAEGAHRVGVWWEGPGPGAALPAALSDLADVTLVSLQTGPAREAAAARLDATRFVDRGDAIGTFRDLASEIRSLDRMIAPNGAVAHLAAALGVETWVLVDRDGSWYWPDEAGPSPWYPNVRVFRQAADASWTVALAAIREALIPAVDADDPPQDSES